jgi:hypothetical protein
MRFKARNRFFVTRSDNWDAFMLQTRPSIHSQMDIDTYFVLAPLASQKEAKDHGKAAFFGQNGNRLDSYNNK